MNGILLDDVNDIVISDGEMVVADITEQAIANVLAASPGEYKEYPMLGVGLIRYLNGLEDPFLIGRIRTQLESVGVKAKKVTINDKGEIDVTV